MMKVIAINDSSNQDGNTGHVLQIMKEELEWQGIEVEVTWAGRLNIHGCIACGYCSTSEQNRCVYQNDIVNETAAKMRETDGFILASPTYYTGIAGTMKSFLDRVFFTSSEYFKYKVATFMAVARRAGGIDVVHQLSNYLNPAETVTPPSQYWAVGYGVEPGEVLRDEEGIQTIRKNARCMTWLLKVIGAGKEHVPFPEEEDHAMINFTR